MVPQGWIYTISCIYFGDLGEDGRIILKSVLNKSYKGVD
jgi:hypothetical protein